MDPNQWAYNQAYRLNASATGIPTNPRFDLPLLEQAAPPGQGLGALPAHTSLTQPRPLSGLTGVSYGHPSLGAVSQFLDTLGTSLVASQAPYKTVAVGQPAYTLESPSRSTTETRLPAPQTPASTAAVVSGKSSWEVGSFVPAATVSNPFSGLPPELATSTAGFSGATASPALVAPPPAHSRSTLPSSRASTIQRNPYQQQAPHTPQQQQQQQPQQQQQQQQQPQPQQQQQQQHPTLQPVTAHSGVSRGNHNVSVYSGLSVASPCAEREPPVAHSHGQFTSYGSSNALLSSGTSLQRSHLSPHGAAQPTLSSSIRSSSEPVMAGQQSYTTSQHLQSSQLNESYSRIIITNSFPEQSKLAQPLETSLTYEAVSPAAPVATPDSAGRDGFNVSLQDLADISSNQEKLPLQRLQRQQVQSAPGSTWVSDRSDHHQAKDGQVPVASAPSHLSSPHLVAGLPTESNPLHPQLSPSSNHASSGSTQVVISLATPQAPSSTVQAQPLPVQAIPDSTTKPRRRSRKKREEKPAVSVSADITPVYEHTPTPTSANSLVQPQFHSAQLAFDNATSYTHQEFGPMDFTPSANGGTGSGRAASRNGSSGGGGDGTVTGGDGVREGEVPPPTQPQPQPQPPPHESVFMTNNFGNTFINPSDAMGTGIGAQPQPNSDGGGGGVGSVVSAFGGSPHSSSSSSHPPQDNHPHRGPPAPAPQPAIAVAINEEVDEEFAHLVAPPLTEVDGVGGDNSLAPAGGATQAAGPEKKPLAAAAAASSAFQNSFLSFLQGNKPETLSSVTNSNVQRPPMPKYIPDPRPVVPLESKVSESSSPPPPPTTTNHRQRRSRRQQQQQQRQRRSDMEMSFTDDDDIVADSSGVTAPKTVSNPLTNITSGEENDLAPTSTGRLRTRGRSGGGGGGGGSTVVSGRNRGGRGGKVRKLSADNGDKDEEFNAAGEDSDDTVVDEVMQKRSPSPAPVRERPSRKAKEKVEEKRREKQERKKRRRSGRLSESEASDLEISSEEEAPAPEDYDSDKDPGWRPSALPDFMPVMADSDSENPGRRMRGRGKRFRAVSSKPSRGRGRVSKPPTATPVLTPAAAPPLLPKVEEPTASPAPTPPVPEPVHLPSSDDDEEPVHRFMKGDFVIERKDLTNYDSFPIWKIDAGRLIQKFEPFITGDQMIHKAMSTYSSWSDAIRHQFKAIKVHLIQTGRGQGQEQVKVLDSFRPTLPEKSEEEEEDGLMPSFNIYMQILISQALEPGFLAAINEEKDEYYHKPLQLVDDTIAASRRLIEQTLPWKETFKNHVDTYPDCKIFDRPNTACTCQAAREGSLKASRVVFLSGEAYDRETLEPLPARTLGKKEYMCHGGIIRSLQVYHGLQHFRQKTYQNCLSKVVALKGANKDLENRDILDQCLQNRTWVQKIFRDLKILMKKASEKT